MQTYLKRADDSLSRFDDARAALAAAVAGARGTLAPKVAATLDGILQQLETAIGRMRTVPSGRPRLRHSFKQGETTDLDIVDLQARLEGEGAALPAPLKALGERARLSFTNVQATAGGVQQRFDAVNELLNQLVVSSLGDEATVSATSRASTRPFSCGHAFDRVGEDGRGDALVLAPAGSASGRRQRPHSGPSRPRIASTSRPTESSSRRSARPRPDAGCLPPRRAAFGEPRSAVLALGQGGQRPFRHPQTC